jgi:eukaryotic-like serine/threonine-protein kinase
MSAGMLREIERLCHEALQLAPGEQTAFVARIGNPEVQLEVRSRLADRTQSEPNAGTVIDQTAPGELWTERVLGHFRVIRQIGRGGMGVVYLAEDLNLNRLVALKLLPAAFQQDPDRVQRFQREARAAAALNHSNIVTVHEVAECDGQHFIATELVDGETLAQRLSRGRLSVTNAFRFFTLRASMMPGTLWIWRRSPFSVCSARLPRTSDT